MLVYRPGRTSALIAERRHEEVVDHVLGRHDQPDGTPDRHVQLVDLALPVQVLELPHPLLADDVDVHRLVGRPRHREEHAGAPDEDHHRDEERDDRPGQLEHQAAVNRGADARRRSSLEANCVKDDESGDEQREEHRDGDQEKVERVDAARHRRRGFGEERRAGPHQGRLPAGWVLGAGCWGRLSRRTMTKMNAPSARTVATPARRSARMMTKPYRPVIGS